MKVILINGSPHKDGCTFTALNEVAKSLEQNEIKTEIIHIGLENIRGCSVTKQINACFTIV